MARPLAGPASGPAVNFAGYITLEELKAGVRLCNTELMLPGGSSGPHLIQGIWARFIPEVLNRQIIDEVITIADEDALETAREVAKREGILCGISSGAAVFVALSLARRPEGKLIVAILPSTGEPNFS